MSSIKNMENLSPDKRALLELMLSSQQPESFPLSYAQQRLWLIDQLEPGTPAYNIRIAIRLCGSLNVPVLERSLNEIVKRHEILRTSFSIIDEETVQVVHTGLNLA